jgi:hypothetical protein
MPKKGRQATRTTPGFTGPFKGNAQQGTLFDKRTLAKTGEEIGPRGYSLNRSRQFQKVVSPMPIEMSTTGADKHPFAGSGVPGQPLAYRTGRGRSKLTDALARSTVKPEHVEGLSKILMQPQHPDYAGSYVGGHIRLHVTEESPEKESYPDEDTKVPFTHPSETRHPEQRGPIDPHSEMTLLHELGHHVSRQQETESSKYRTPEERGREEGRADAFMMKHYREDPRTVRWRGRTDPREHSYGARGQAERFGTGKGPVEYFRALSPQNMRPPSPTLHIFGGEGAKTERHERPMLDEPLPEHEQVFTQHLKGWNYPGDKPQEQRTGLYNKAAQLTNMRRGVGQKERADVKRRWGVNRNLGQQWKASDEP